MKLKERSSNISIQERFTAANRSLLKVKCIQLGGGVKYSMKNKENLYLTVDSCKENEVSRSYSVFSTQTGSSFKEELTDRTDLISIFKAWKEIVPAKQKAWGLLGGDFKKLIKKKIGLEGSIVWLKKKINLLKIFQAWKSSITKPRKPKPIFIKKYLISWRTFLSSQKRSYRNIYKIHEARLFSLQKQVFASWKRIHALKKSLKKLFSCINSKLLTHSFSSIKHYLTSKIFHIKFINHFINSKLKSQKSLYFHRWSRYIYTSSKRIHASYISEYELKISSLLKQIVLQSQELFKEKQMNSSREAQMKALLDVHAKQLYEDLCLK